MFKRVLFKQIIYSIYFLFILTSNVLSQPDLKFVRYTTEQGLVNDDVMSICQDSLGFLWFGTKTGCSRFDGVEFENFQQHEYNTGHSIPAANINKIVCDKQNSLWFAIAGQINTLIKYDYLTDSFADYSKIIRSHLKIDNDKMFPIWNIYSDSDGYLWITTSVAGTICYNPNNNQLITPVKKSFNNLPFTRDYLEDKDNNLWFITSEGVFIFNKEDHILHQYKNEPKNPQSISTNNCNCIYQDSNAEIWIGTYNGLNRLVSFSASKDTAFFKRYMHKPDNTNSLSNNLVYDITEYDDNNIIIGTVNGLCLLDKTSGKIFHYLNNEIDDESINSNLIRSLFRDKHGNIWAGTTAGIGKLQIKNFKSYQHSSYKNSISHNKVQAICESPDSKIWIATPKGVDIFDRNTGLFRFLVGITTNNEGLYGAPVSLFSDNDNMWIGTWEGGISSYDYNSNKFFNYKNNSDFKNVNNAFSLFVDRKNILWIGAIDEGIFLYNKETGDNKIISHNNKNSLSLNRVSVILEDSESEIWVGTFNRLNRLIDREKGVFKHYLNGKQIYCITESSDKKLWIGTNLGLFCYDRATDKIKEINYNNKLSQTNIYGILEDKNNNFWISTNKGLLKLILNWNSTPEIIYFRPEEGLKQGTFLLNSSAKLSDGTMLFGGDKGFCMFNPEKIKIDTLLPTVILTGLKVANRPVRAAQSINNQIILHKSIGLTNQLKLNYKNNAFSIQFAGLQYNLPQYIKYAYRLDGYDPRDDDWHPANANDREVEYMNLPAGDYIFRVKAANSYGLWNDKEAILKITIQPPWWQTNWFTTLWILMLIGLVFLLFRIRTYRLQKQKQKLELLVEKRTRQLQEMNLNLEDGKKEIEQQAQKMSALNAELLKTNANLKAKTFEIEEMANKVHEADQKQLQFFANISHEFRTPLTLIIGPVERCLNLEKPVDWNKVNITKYLLLILRNSQRLLRLVNEIISFRKIVHGGKKINLSNNNIIEFTQTIVDAFYLMAEAKKIQLKLVEKQLIASLHNFWFDPDVMEKILYNLISNAIKYTPEGGEISIAIGIVGVETRSIVGVETRSIASLQNNQLSIKISDTGIGIKPENIDKIFDRFYRVETHHIETYGSASLHENQPEGTGIGLAYTKQLVELHSGTISVQSKYGKGTTFILSFPIGLKDNISHENETNSELKTSISKSLKLDYSHSALNLEDSTDLSKDTADNEESGVIKTVETESNPSSVLLVEDNTDLRHFIKGELEEEYTVYEAANGEQGLEKAVEISPNLIVSDIMMPVMDGVTLCEKIKSDENTSHIPVILLTAKSGEKNMFKGLETGADDYITKPFSMRILKVKIKNILVSRKRLQEKFGRSIDLIPTEITHSQLDEKFIEKAISVVNDNILNTEFTNDDFVSHTGYGRTQTYKKIKDITGQSVSEFIRTIRLKTAAQLLLKGNQNIKDICYQVGFKHPNTFTNYFTKMFGKPPSQFIKDAVKK